MAGVALPQTYANHRRFVPAFHFVAFGILLLNLGWTGWSLVREPSPGAAVGVLLAVALLILFFCMRLFALTVQDRVIRLEMRLRLARLLPPDLQARVPELSVGQLVALRFAGDGELPDLVRWVLADRVDDLDAIKRRIRDWQPDTLRA
jgi:hypothetical protein